jgi:hypothetical protein
MTRRSVYRVTILALPLLVAFVVSSGAATIGAGETAKILQEGNYLFMKANELSKEDPWQAKDLYQKAATHFESLASEGGIRSGKLYYNIGNAYFMANDLGRAILNYKRSLVYDPNDTNLAQNIEYARSKRADKINVKESAKIFEIIFFWHFNISSGVRIFVFLAMFAIVWICLAARLFIRKTLLDWGLVLSAIVACLFLGSLTIDAFSSAGSKPGVVIAEEVTARKGDGDTYEPSFQAPLHAGVEFDLVEARRGWCNIELTDGTRGWVPANAVGIVDSDYKTPM